LWTLLNGEENEGITREDLNYMLLVVKGSRIPDREVDEPADTSRPAGIQRVALHKKDDDDDEEASQP